MVVNRYIVVWQQGGNVYSRGVLPNGTVTGEMFIIQETAVNQQNSTIAYGVNGRTLSPPTRNEVHTASSICLFGQHFHMGQHGGDTV